MLIRGSALHKTLTPSDPVLFHWPAPSLRSELEALAKSLDWKKQLWSECKPTDLTR